MKIIKFSSEFCEPCKFYSPIFSKVVSQMQQFIKDIEVINIDIDEDNNAGIIEQYNIHSIPATVIEDKNGDIVCLKYGALTEQDLKTQLEIAQARDAK